MKRSGLPVIHITAVPTVRKMVGVTRILRSQSVTCVLGNPELKKEDEATLRRKYVLRALEIFKVDIAGNCVFTLEGTG